MQKELPYDIKMLLEQVGNDDERAFRMVFDYYKVPFYSTAFKMTRSGDIATEIIQEAFVTLWVKRKLVAMAKKPEAYLFTILHNCIYAHFRKLAQDRRLEIKMGQEREESDNYIERVLIEKENRTILTNVINKLPLQQSIIYKMAKQEGLSRNEIAKQLNISPNTVKNHLAAAVAYLRECLKALVSTIFWILTSAVL